jgi:hypothetical protein
LYGIRQHMANRFVSLIIEVVSDCRQIIVAPQESPCRGRGAFFPTKNRSAVVRGLQSPPRRHLRTARSVWFAALHPGGYRGQGRSNDHGLLDRRLITQLVTTRARGPHLHQLGRDYCSGHEAEPFPGGHARPHSRLVTEMRHEANRLAVAPRIRKVSSRTLLWYSGNPARVLPTPVRYIPNPDGVLGDDDNNRILATSVLRAVSVMCRFPVRRHMPVLN